MMTKNLEIKFENGTLVTQSGEFSHANYFKWDTRTQNFRAPARVHAQVAKAQPGSKKLFDLQKNLNLRDYQKQALGASIIHERKKTQYP